MYIQIKWGKSSEVLQICCKYTYLCMPAGTRAFLILYIQKRPRERKGVLSSVAKNLLVNR